MSSASPATLPPDIVDYLRQLNEANRRAADVVSGLSNDQASWQPDQGASWSVSQCLEHMANANRVYLEPLKLAAKKAGTGHTPYRTAGWFSRYFLRKTEPPPTTKIKAPRKIGPHSATPINKLEALAQFLRYNHAVERFVVDTAALDLCGVRFKNPFIPGLNFTVATGLLIIAAHNRRHLWQAEQVVTNREFPR